MAGRFLTEEQRKQYAERRCQTMLARYGKASVTNAAKGRYTKAERYGDPNYNNMAKNKATCFERYGYDHHNQNPEVKAKISISKKSAEAQAKFEATCIERYGSANINLILEFQARRKATLRDRYGVSSPLQNPCIKAKQLDTLKQNGSFTSSKIEEQIYERLLQNFEASDILRQYNKDPRHPFNCDFYVKSRDLFIEVNNHPSHGGHPYNPDSREDQEILSQLQQDESRWASMIIDVWTVRDRLKIQTAQLNNLNYLMIYKNIDELIIE